MAAWNSASQRVSEFVDHFLDRALGAANNVAQRVPVYDTLENKFYLGKLLPQVASEGGTEYKAKVAPCSYIATFLVRGKPARVSLTVMPSFNLYFRTAVPKVAGTDRDADAATLPIYSEQADPAPPATWGRADMWVVWQSRKRTVPQEYLDALTALEAADDAEGKMWGKYDPQKAVGAHIRKRYCTSVAVEMEFPATGEVARATAPLDLSAFRKAYAKLGSAPAWSGVVEAIASREGENTRVTVYLTNTVAQNTRLDANWYDTHLRIELLNAEVEPVDCRVLNKAGGRLFPVTAEAKNCAFDPATSTTTVLNFGPVARAKTQRRVARELDYSFEQSTQDPEQLMNTFLSALEGSGAGADTVDGYRRDVESIRSDPKAVEAIRLVSRVYATSVAANGRWRYHQIATLLRFAAIYLRREAKRGEAPAPIVLNVPTAGGKTEGFFGAAMFSAFYELQRKRRAVSIIKYPMTLLSSDQIARLSRYSMVADELALEIAGKPLGIAYMVGKKGMYNSPSDVIERCPYPVPANEGGACGAAWAPCTYSGGVPTLQCSEGHQLHLGVDKGEQITRQCPAFIVATWDKFISQSQSRRLALLFGATRYYCPTHGFIDFAEANQFYGRGNQLPDEIKCTAISEGNGGPCGRAAQKASSTVPGALVFDEAHLMREADGTLDSHFETAYIQIAKDLSGMQPVPIVSTATIAGISEFMGQLGLCQGVAVSGSTPEGYYVMPEPGEQSVFFVELPGEMQHDTAAVAPFDVMLTWAVPDLIDVFFETLAEDYGYDATDAGAQPPGGLEHLRQVMAYCSSYKNINALGEMNAGAVADSRLRRGRQRLKTRQLSSRYFTRESARQAIEHVKKVSQQILYATNIASIGVDIGNLNAIFFFGLPTNVSEFIQALNRTGREPGKPAVCIAVLGPNKERDMSYYRYWNQFIQGANYIVEPVPLNRYASTAVRRTFNNVATAVILMAYSQQKQRKLFYAGDVRTALATGLVPEQQILAELKEIYRAESDPAQEYPQLIDDLWAEYKARMDTAKNYNTFVWEACAPDWMYQLRSRQKQTQVFYPDAAALVERNASGALVTGDIDTDAPAEVGAEGSGEGE